MAQVGMKRHWIQVAGSIRSDYEVMRAICAGLPDEKCFLPDYEVLEGFGLDVSQPLRILDFGAGMLRNSVGLLQMSTSWEVTAYDSEQMLSRGLKKFGNSLKKSCRLCLKSDWEALKAERFDAVLAILVFQHIEEGPLHEISYELTTMTDKLCVFGRRSLDNYYQESWTPLWPIVMRYWSPVTVFSKAIAHPSENISSPTREKLPCGDRHDHTGVVCRPLKGACGTPS